MNKETKFFKPLFIYKIMIHFILIITEPAREHEIYNQLNRTEEILEVHPLFGEYDLILKLECKTTEEATTVIKKIRQMEGVLAIKTLMGIGGN